MSVLQCFVRPRAPYCVCVSPLLTKESYKFAFSSSYGPLFSKNSLRRMLHLSNPSVLRIGDKVIARFPLYNVFLDNWKMTSTGNANLSFYFLLHIPFLSFDRVISSQYLHKSLLIFNI